MTLVESIDSLRDWFEENICQKVTFKVPNDTSIDGNVQLIHPASFALYVPGRDRLPPNVEAPIPSVCVQLMDGEDRPMEGKTKLNIRLCLAVWNPGDQTGADFYPTPDFTKPIGYKYKQGAENPTYTRNLDGWRDITNFLDLIRLELGKHDIIAGQRIVKEEPIKYGPFMQDGAMWDSYPYWHSWITFALESGGMKTMPIEHESLL